MINKLTLLHRIERRKHRAEVCRRIYSFYRVANAVILSCTMVVCMVVVVVVSSRPDRSVNILAAMTEKIGDFLGVHASEAVSGADSYFVNQLDIARDIVFGFSIIYSGVMIISGIVRYAYLSKCGNVIVGGLVFISLYVLCHVVFRLTLFIAMFTTAETSDKRKDSGFVIASVPSAIMAAFIIVVHFIVTYVFKRKFVGSFAKCRDPVEKLIHVLVNTVVALPFDPVEEDDDPLAARQTEGQQKLTFPLSRTMSYPGSSTTRLNVPGDGRGLGGGSGEYKMKNLKHTKSAAKLNAPVSMINKRKWPL